MFRHGQLIWKMKKINAKSVSTALEPLKDAVNGLFQGAVTALNGSNNIPWHYSALIWHPILSWHLPTRPKAVYPSRWWSFQCIQRCSWRALPGCHDSFEWHTLTWSCLNKTCHSPVTIANSRASCLSLIDDGSFKCFQKWSWRAVPGHPDSSEWFKWHT